MKPYSAMTNYMTDYTRSIARWEFLLKNRGLWVVKEAKRTPRFPRGRQGDLSLIAVSKHFFLHPSLLECLCSCGHTSLSAADHLYRSCRSIISSVPCLWVKDIDWKDTKEPGLSNERSGLKESNHRPGEKPVTGSGRSELSLICKTEEKISL